jgi:hypothetical protein
VWKQSCFVPLRARADREVWFKRKSLVCPWRRTSSSCHSESVCKASVIQKASLFLNLNSFEDESAHSSETSVSAYKTPHHNPEDHNPSMNNLFLIGFISHGCNFSIGANENYLIGWYHCMTEHTER